MEVLFASLIGFIVFIWFLYLTIRDAIKSAIGKELKMQTEILSLIAQQNGVSVENLNQIK